MTLATYDFVVLGDSQPEGLLVASALVRKGLSVGLIPSAQLGEIQGEEVFPATFPVSVRGRKVDDLLFRAGFFRLEDSGLVPVSAQIQTLLPRHRLNLEGGKERWIIELRREFPSISDLFEKSIERLQKDSRSLKKASGEILELEKRDPLFGRWLEDLIEWSVQPSAPSLSSNQRENKEEPSEISRARRRRNLERFLETFVLQGGRVYRVDPRLKTSYSSFLVEHARKWGVHILDQPLTLKSLWGAYQISASHRARALIANSWGGQRAIGRSLVKESGDRLEAWLYFDRLEVPLALVPEPLQEFCGIDLDTDTTSEKSRRWLHIRRDVLRDEALLTLGTWLPFEDSKSWTEQIERGRASLLKLLPFLKKEMFRNIPNLLELTEMRGECVRRGQMERLRTRGGNIAGWKRLMRWIKVPKRPTSSFARGRRIYSLCSIDFPYQHRDSSFERSLDLVDSMDRKRKRLTPSSLF